MGSRFSQKTRMEIFQKYNGKCAVCGRQLQNDKERCFDEDYMQIDHIIPRSLGGSDRKDNLRAICKHCNSVKNNYTGEKLKNHLINRILYSVLDRTQITRIVDDLEGKRLTVDDIKDLKRLIESVYRRNLSAINHLIFYVKEIDTEKENNSCSGRI